MTSFLSARQEDISDYIHLSCRVRWLFEVENQPILLLRHKQDEEDEPNEEAKSVHN
jgi:hypothetical protein